MPRPQKPQTPTDAILTLPNLVTFARLALAPIFLILGLDDDTIAFAFIVGAVAGSTDWIDGRLARRLGQVSKLGIKMDPFVDRLLIAAGAAILIVQGFAPLWAVIAVIARDALVLAAVPVFTKRKLALPPVSWWGKAATMGLMFAFGMWIGAHMTSPPQRWMQVVAWVCFVPGIVFSYLAAAGYARELKRALRKAQA